MFNPTMDAHLDMSPVDFEKHALIILHQQLQGIENCLFEHNKIIEVGDGNYQIDGYIEFSLMGVTYKTLVECKHYKGSIEREKVQVLFDKLRACGAQKGILVSSSNFQSGAITYAALHGIALIQLTESGNQYYSRGWNRVGDMHNHMHDNGCSSYIGVMQTSSSESSILCSYLSKTNLALKDFLES